jgi:hypothetical protein
MQLWDSTMPNLLNMLQKVTILKYGTMYTIIVLPQKDLVPDLTSSVLIYCTYIASMIYI